MSTPVAEPLTSLPGAIRDFLGAATPDAWLEAAAQPEALPLLLVDHANCEKKAASTALSLLFRYEQETGLAGRMSRLAREELRHFEQVQQLMGRLGIPWTPVGASRYGRGLAEVTRSPEPGRLVDRLIVGAFIEARSCERFALLAPRLPPEVGRFYSGLLASEARHFRHYLALAEDFAGGSVAERTAEIRIVENQLATESDTELRFHSGPPA
ncbi:MAG: tRNA-(ms[2]io[6]A)-hydroxylase [Gammaproteobacteria bacterium]